MKSDFSNEVHGFQFFRPSGKRVIDLIEPLVPYMPEIQEAPKEKKGKAEVCAI